MKSGLVSQQTSPLLQWLKLFWTEVISLVARTLTKLRKEMANRRNARPENQPRDGLNRVHVGGHRFGLVLDEDTANRFRSFATASDSDTRDAAEDSMLIEEAKVYADQLDHEIAVSKEARKRTMSACEDMIARFRYEHLFSAAGLFLASLIAALLAFGGYLVNADFTVARAQFLESLLFDKPTANPNAPLENPSLTLVTAVCLVPIALQLAALKFWFHPPNVERALSFRVLSLTTMLLSGLLIVGFAFLVGGHESILVAVSQDGLTSYFEPQMVLGVVQGKSSMPCEYVACVMFAISFVFAGICCYLPSKVKPFFDHVDVSATRFNSRRIAFINDALNMTVRTRAEVSAVFSKAEQIVRKQTMHIEDEIADSEHQTAKAKRRLDAGLLSILLLVFLTGCAGFSSSSPAVDVAAPEPVALASAVTPETETTNVSVFLADGVPTDVIKPWIYRLITQQLAGDSRLSVFAGSGHEHIVTLGIPYGVPQVRIRNQSLQTAIVRLDAFFESRSGQGSAEINWPGIAYRLSDRPETGCNRDWVIIAGDPCYRNENDPAYTFTGDRYPTVPLIKIKSPFTDHVPIRSGTRVSFLSHKANWGDSINQEQKIRDFQAVYWQALGGNLIALSSSVIQAFNPDGKALSPTTTPDWSGPRQMRIASPPAIPPATVPDPIPTVVPVERDRNSLEEVGSIPYQIEMAGGSLKDLKNDSITILVFMDSSLSMESQITSLSTTIRTLTQQVAPLVQTLKIGIVAASADKRRDFPIQAIASETSRSYRSLDSFLSDIEPENGDYPTLDIIRECVRLLHKTRPSVAQEQPGTHHKIFLMMTDIVHHEVDDDRLAAEKREVLGGVRRWCNLDDTDNRFLAYFSGPGTGDQNAFSEEEQSAFIRELVSADPKGMLSTDSQVLIDAVIAAALPEDINALLKADG